MLTISDIGAASLWIGILIQPARALRDRAMYWSQVLQKRR
jgi:hypothetical protein